MSVEVHGISMISQIQDLSINISSFSLQNDENLKTCIESNTHTADSIPIDGINNIHNIITE